MHINYGGIVIITTTVPLLSQAPSLLITLINMFLGFGSSPVVHDHKDPTNTTNEFSVFGPTDELATLQVIHKII